MDSENVSIVSRPLTVVTNLDSIPTQKASELRPTELPPAYTPTNRSSIIDNLVTYFTHQSAAHEVNAQIPRVVPFPQISASTDLPDEEHDALSPISLHISTHINVSSDGNLIALPCSPSDQAKSIAKAVVEAFQGQDWSAGLPMIDESGRPRPLKLEVDAGMTIKGSSNVIGTEPIIREVLRSRRHSEDLACSSPHQSSGPSAATSSSSPKRRRQVSDLDPIEQPGNKRVRNEA